VAEVVEKDLGYLAILRNIAEMDGKAVLVGLQADGTTGDKGVLVAHYGAINEFGSANGHVPERSFMRSTFDNTVGKLNDLRTRLVDGVIEGKIDARTAGNLLGEQHQQDIQKTITSGVPPPNAPGTIKRKGSSGTLRDTMLMHNSIRYVIEDHPGSSMSALITLVKAKFRKWG
jgi:hypothetical protein